MEKRLAPAPSRATLGLLAALLVPALAPSAAAALDVSAALSSDRVLVGDVVTLEVSVVWTTDGDVAIDVPNVDGLVELRRGRSDSTSLSWTGNGRSTRHERMVRIDYEAATAGTVTIPAIKVSSGGVSKATPALKLTVVGGRDEPPQATSPSEPAQAGVVAPPTADEGNLFVRYRVDRAEAFVGEQVLLDLEVYMNGNYGLEEAAKPPTLDRFWREILDQPTTLVARTERVGGRVFRVYRLWRMALFGLEAGRHAVGPSTLGFSQNRSIFSPGTRLRRSTPPIELTIVPLPAAGRPPDFIASNVGALTLDARVDATQVDAAKGVTLRVLLGGAANIAQLRPPEVRQLDGFRVFPARLTDEIQRTPTGVTGTKVAEILLVPTRTGALTIPPLSTASFDPERRAYESLSTPPITIEVTGTLAASPSAPPNPQAPASGAPSSANAPGDGLEGLRPIRVGGAVDTRRAFVGTPTFWGLLALPIAAALLAAGLARALRARGGEAPERVRERREAELRARLEDAQGAAARGRAVEATTIAADVLLELYSMRTGIELRGLTVAEQRARLSALGAPEGFLDVFFQVFELADLVRFAPGAAEASQVNALITRATRLVESGWSPRGASPSARGDDA